jgi:hypothetical protein
MVLSSNFPIFDAERGSSLSHLPKTILAGTTLAVTTIALSYFSNTALLMAAAGTSFLCLGSIYQAISLSNRETIKKVIQISLLVLGSLMAGWQIFSGANLMIRFGSEFAALKLGSASWTLAQLTASSALFIDVARRFLSAALETSQTFDSPELDQFISEFIKRRDSKRGVGSEDKGLAIMAILLSRLTPDFRNQCLDLNSVFYRILRLPILKKYDLINQKFLDNIIQLIPKSTLQDFIQRYLSALKDKEIYFQLTDSQITTICLIISDLISGINTLDEQQKCEEQFKKVFQDLLPNLPLETLTVFFQQETYRSLLKQKIDLYLTALEKIPTCFERLRRIKSEIANPASFGSTSPIDLFIEVKNTLREIQALKFFFKSFYTQDEPARSEVLALCRKHSIALEEALSYLQNDEIDIQLSALNSIIVGVSNLKLDVQERTRIATLASSIDAARSLSSLEWFTQVGKAYTDLRSSEDPLVGILYKLMGIERIIHQASLQGFFSDESKNWVEKTLLELEKESNAEFETKWRVLSNKFESLKRQGTLPTDFLRELKEIKKTLEAGIEQNSVQNFIFCLKIVKDEVEDSTLEGSLFILKRAVKQVRKDLSILTLFEEFQDLAKTLTRIQSLRSLKNDSSVSEVSEAYLTIVTTKFKMEGSGKAVLFKDFAELNEWLQNPRDEIDKEALSQKLAEIGLKTHEDLFTHNILSKKGTSLESFKQNLKAYIERKAPALKDPENIEASSKSMIASASRIYHIASVAFVNLGALFLVFTSVAGSPLYALAGFLISLTSRILRPEDTYGFLSPRRQRFIATFFLIERLSVSRFIIITPSRNREFFPLSYRYLYPLTFQFSLASFFTAVSFFRNSRAALQGFYLGEKLALLLAPYIRPSQVEMNT